MAESGVAELDLLVVGDANPDVIVSSPDLEPRFGQAEQLVDSAALVVGGSGAITAMGAARLGLRVGLCAVVGNDDLGRLMTVKLAEAGVDLEHLVVDAYRPTGMSVILNRGDDRAVLTASGTISALTPDDLAALPDHPGPARARGVVPPDDSGVPGGPSRRLPALPGRRCDHVGRHELGSCGAVGRPEPAAGDRRVPAERG